MLLQYWIANDIQEIPEGIPSLMDGVQGRLPVTHRGSDSCQGCVTAPSTEPQATTG